MELMFKIYDGLEREGPGSPEVTGRALDLCRDLPEEPEILELGCGSGGATITLARESGGSVIATDVYQPFLDRLMDRAREAGVDDRISARISDMADLPFGPESFDLIWCEGAAYIMGVDKALAAWKPLLRPGGYLAFTDAVWLADDRPAELEAYWAGAYPAMRTAGENETSARSLGYEVVGGFIVPEPCWDTFYADLERQLRVMEAKYGQDPAGRAVLDEAWGELVIHRKYPGSYGYAFHVLRT